MLHPKWSKRRGRTPPTRALVSSRSSVMAAKSATPTITFSLRGPRTSTATTASSGRRRACLPAVWRKDIYGKPTQPLSDPWWSAARLCRDTPRDRGLSSQAIWRLISPPTTTAIWVGQGQGWRHQLVSLVSVQTGWQCSLLPAPGQTEEGTQLTGWKWWGQRCFCFFLMLQERKCWSFLLSLSWWMLNHCSWIVYLPKIVELMSSLKLLWCFCKLTKKSLH